MKRLILTVATLFALTATAHAFGDIIQQEPPRSAPLGSHFIENVPVKQNPFDDGHLNESPIRGKGQIRVEHNMPTPGDPDQKLTEALWLLQDNSWTCYKPKVSRR